MWYVLLAIQPLRLWEIFNLTCSEAQHIASHHMMPSSVILSSIDTASITIDYSGTLSSPSLPAFTNDICASFYFYLFLSLNVAAVLGCDKVIYNDLEDIVEAVRSCNPDALLVSIPSSLPSLLSRSLLSPVLSCPVPSCPSLPPFLLCPITTWFTLHSKLSLSLSHTQWSTTHHITSHHLSNIMSYLSPFQDFDTSCFSGIYPTEEVTPAYLEALESGRGRHRKAAHSSSSSSNGEHSQEQEQRYDLMCCTLLYCATHICTLFSFSLSLLLDLLFIS